MRATSKSEAAQWWFETIQLWDYIPAEHVIIHPQLVWNQLYKEIYLPEIKLWGSTVIVYSVSLSLSLCQSQSVSLSLFVLVPVWL